MCNLLMLSIRFQIATHCRYRNAFRRLQAKNNISEGETVHVAEPKTNYGHFS